MIEAVQVGDIGPETDWSKALNGVDAVVHLAARVHIVDDTASDPLSAITHFRSRPQLNIKAESFNPSTIVPTYGAGAVNTFDPQITPVPSP